MMSTEPSAWRSTAGLRTGSRTRPAGFEATGKLITVLAPASARYLNGNGYLIPDPSGRHPACAGLGPEQHRRTRHRDASAVGPARPLSQPAAWRRLVTCIDTREPVCVRSSIAITKHTRSGWELARSCA